MRNRKYETDWSSIVAHSKVFISLTYLLMKTLSEAQKKLISMYATKAKLLPSEVIKWVEEEKVTISEISQGILGTKVN